MKPLLGRFPLLLGLAALLIYLATLSHDLAVLVSLGRLVIFGNLELAAKINGWDWLPWENRPLLWVLTLPLRLLPNHWIPCLLNVFSAVGAAGTLVLLAESLQLLPWTNPSLAISGWRQRLPIVLAVLVCGLELNFWQHATIATGEMLDVLVFASAVFCVLKHRATQDFRWLHASAFIWGLGMAENWMMILTLPVFVITIFATNPFQMLDKQFVLRLAGWGLAGFAIFILLPVVNSLAPESPLDFKAAWVNPLLQVRHILSRLLFSFFWLHQGLGFAFLAYYLMPVVAWLLCRFNDEPMNQPTLDQLQIFLIRTLRTGVLLVCLWAALDPVYGPRYILKNQLHFDLPLLSFDYVIALGTGMLAGNLLTIGQRNIPPSPRPFFLDFLFFWQERITPIFLIIVTTLTGTLLVSRNQPAISQANQKPLNQLGELAVRSLPPGGGLVFAESESAVLLVIFHAAQSHHPEVRGWIPINVSALASKEYRAWLNHKYPKLELPATNRGNLAPAELRNWIDRQAGSHRVIYLHPSSGYFFEASYLEPRGAVYELKPFVSNVVSPPPPTTAELAENEKLWADTQAEMESLRLTTTNNHAMANFLANTLKLEPIHFAQGDILKSWYSQALNSRGVQLQRTGRLPEAAECFSRAIKLNELNWVARLNHFANTNLQAGNALNLADAPRMSEKIPNASLANQLLGQFGPADEPAYCFVLGNAFGHAKLLRQAMQQFERAAALAPGEAAPKFALTSLYIRTHLDRQAEAMIQQLHEQIGAWPAANPAHLKLSSLEANYFQSQTNLAATRQILSDLIPSHLDDINGLENIVQAYISMQDFAEAEAAFDHHLANLPNNPFLLQAKSEILIQSGQAGAAIPVLDQLLELTNYPPAKFNRAIAFLRTSNYAAAQADFLDLTNTPAISSSVEYGLAESALGFGETNRATQYLKKCMADSPRNSIVWLKASTKLKELQPANN